MDGIWGPKTEASLQELRESLGLEPGGLDKGLWAAVFDTPPMRPYWSKTDEAIALPGSAVDLGITDESDADEETAKRFTLAGRHDVEAVHARITRSTPSSAGGPWRRCPVDEASDYTIVYRWEGSGSNRLAVAVEDMGGGRVDIQIEMVPFASEWVCEPTRTTTTKQPSNSATGPTTTRPRPTTTVPSSTTRPTLNRLCDEVTRFMEGYADGIRVTQCEVQNGWFITQTNDIAEWNGFIDDVVSGDLPMTAAFEMPAAAFSAGLVTIGADPRQFDRYIFSVQDSCQTVVEYQTADIAAAVSAFTRDMSEWFEITQDAWLNGSISTLDKAGC